MLEQGKEGSIFCIIADETVGKELASLQCSCIAVKALQIIRCCKATAGAALLPQPVLACLSFSKKGHLSLHFTTFGFLTMIFSKSTTKHSGNRRKGGAPAGCVFLVGRGESSFPIGTACNRSLFHYGKRKKRLGCFQMSV